MTLFDQKWSTPDQQVPRTGLLQNKLATLSRRYLTGLGGTSRDDCRCHRGINGPLKYIHDYLHKIDSHGGDNTYHNAYLRHHQPSIGRDDIVEALENVSYRLAGRALATKLLQEVDVPLPFDKTCDEFHLADVQRYKIKKSFGSSRMDLVGSLERAIFKAELFDEHNGCDYSGHWTGQLADYIVWGLFLWTFSERDEEEDAGKIEDKDEVVEKILLMKEYYEDMKENIKAGFAYDESSALNALFQAGGSPSEKEEAVVAFLSGNLSARTSKL
jgi:hypothetical protein